MDNSRLKNKINNIIIDANNLLLNLDNINIFKFYLGKLNYNIEELNSYTIARDKY